MLAFSPEVYRARHLFWDTMNNGTPVLSRKKADCHHSWTVKRAHRINMMHHPRAELALPTKRKSLKCEVSRNIYFGTLGMYFGTLARASRDVTISPLLFARYLGTLKPWSQQQFLMKPLSLHQTRPWRTAGTGVMNNGTPFSPSEKAVGHTFAMSIDSSLSRLAFSVLVETLL